MIDRTPLSVSTKGSRGRRQVKTKNIYSMNEIRQSVFASQKRHSQNWEKIEKNKTGTQ